MQFTLISPFSLIIFNLFVIIFAASPTSITTKAASLLNLSGLCVANSSQITAKGLSTSTSSTNLGISVKPSFTSYLPNQKAQSIIITQSNPSSSNPIVGFILYGNMPTLNHIGSFVTTTGQTIDSSCVHRTDVADDDNSTLITTTAPDLSKGLTISWVPPTAYGDGSVIFTGAFFAKDGTYQLTQAQPVIEADAYNFTGNPHILSASIPTQSEGAFGNGGAIPTSTAAPSTNGTTSAAMKFSNSLIRTTLVSSAILLGFFLVAI